MMTYGISSYLNYSMYSSLFGGSYGSSYGNFGSTNSLFGCSSLFGSSQRNSWSNMVPNYGGINYSLLEKYYSGSYSSIKDSLNAIAKQESNSKAFYSDFNSVFSNLKSASSALKAFSSNSVFRPTGYGSSNSDVASVTSDMAASTNSYKLNVTQTAQAQSYTSSAVKSTGNTLAGKTTLTLTGADGKKSTFNFDFDSTKNNKSYYEQIASAVNGRDLGITASVTEKNGQSTLTFQADKTGTKSQFEVEFSGSLAEKIGMEEDQEAKDAIYSVNGGENQTSQSNNITLSGERINVTLKGEGTTEISRKTVDNSRTIDAIKKFADSYNKTLSFLNENKDVSTAVSDLAYSFATTRFQSGALSKIGIAVDMNGALSVNESKLSQALKQNPQDVEKILGGASGIASNAYGKTVNAMNNSRNLYPQSVGVSYSNYMYGRDQSYVNAYTNGMFLSSLI